MDNKKVEEILSDILKLDPSLKTKEKEIRRIIEGFLSARPIIKLDKKSIQALKEKILQRLEETDNMKIKKFDWLSFSYFFVATMSVFVLFLIAGLSPFLKDYSFGKPSYKKSSVASIIEVSSRAFGDLSSTESNTAPAGQTYQDYSVNSVETITDASFSGSGVKNVPEIAVVSESDGGWRYSYDGENFSQDNEFMPVYAETEESFGENFSEIVSAAEKLNFKAVNFSNIENLEVNYLSFKENHDFGLIFGIFPTANNFQATKNSDKWPDVRKEYLKTISEIPSDGELLKIANDFVNNYGIDLSDFGEPVIQGSWRLSYGNSSDKIKKYFPEEISIVYPLIINGLEVYDQNGNEYGLSIGIDVRQKKVANASGPLNFSFESSNYEVLTDSSAIIEEAELGGLNSRSYVVIETAEGGESAIIRLGDPRLILVSQQKYDEIAAKTRKIFIPAYLFPISYRPEGLDYLYSKNIVVPLTKDFYQNNSVPAATSDLLEKEVILRQELSVD